MITLNGRGNWKKIVDKFGGECCVEYVWRKIFDRNFFGGNFGKLVMDKIFGNFWRKCHLLTSLKKNIAYVGCLKHFVFVFVFVFIVVQN